MKIFLTGATGYIGQRLAEKLLESEQNEVHALCRRKPENSAFQNPRFHFYEGDLENVDAIHEAMRGCEAVFHVAAIAKVWMKNPVTYYDINVKGTINVLDAALSNKVDKVIFTSSAAVYGASYGTPLTEGNVRMNSFFTDYEASKFIAEERIQHYVRKGLNVVIVHPTKVYGPGIWTESNAVSQLIRRYMAGKWRIIPGNGKMIGNFSYIDDVVNGHILAYHKGRAGEKYILGGTNLSFNDLFALIKGISGKNYLTVHIPYPLMMLYGWQEEFLPKIFGREPKITRQWIKKYNYDLALSSEKAQRELNYTITPVEMGLKNTIDWVARHPR